MERSISTIGVIIRDGKQVSQIREQACVEDILPKSRDRSGVEPDSYVEDWQQVDRSGNRIAT